MKRALLWLGPLACLALACLYAYAWFNRDPLSVAFDRIEIGDSLEIVIEKTGGSPQFSGPWDANMRVCRWNSENFAFLVYFDEDRVAYKGVWLDRSAFEKTWAWIKSIAILGGHQ